MREVDEDEGEEQQPYRAARRPRRQPAPRIRFEYLAPAPAHPACRLVDPRLSSVEARRLVAGDLFEEFGRTTQQRFWRRAGHPVHPQLDDRSPRGHGPILTR